MKTFKLDICSDFNQILFSDEEWEGEDGPTDWTDDDVAKFICVGTYAIGLGVVENDDHIILVNLHEQAPPLNEEEWSHIVEAPFEAASGNIDVEGEEIEIPSGKYILRWSFHKVDDENIKYQIDLWNGQLDTVNVIKSYS